MELGEERQPYLLGDWVHIVATVICGKANTRQ
jgi:hypothetical protein